MYKMIPETKTRDARGFTLTEILVVIAIVGVFTAVAIPTFLGHREKAKVRSVQASAVESVQDLQAYLDAYVAGDPYMFIDGSGKQTCTQSSKAAGTGRTCAALYPGVVVNGVAYPAYPSGLSKVLQSFRINHTNCGDKSPYNGSALFTTTPGVGVIVVTASGLSGATLTAYGSNSTHAIFSQLVVSR